MNPTKDQEQLTTLKREIINLPRNLRKSRDNESERMVKVLPSS
jgi:hypothetical protein